MKKIMRFFESTRDSIKITYLAFGLIAIGFIIQNDAVNLFYTFKSSVVLFIGELFLKVGELIVMNLPLIFMLNGVCKKANNASPVVTALVGYFTLIVTTMLFASQNLSSDAYMSGYGINSIFNMGSGNRLPLQTGMIGSLLVALATRISFILSRRRNNYSLSNLFSKDISGIIYNVVLCFFCGVLISYAYPFAYVYLQKVINFIAEDLTDPFRIGLYSVLDRILSILGLGNVIRNPFWYTSLGGSVQNSLTGKSILGDLNIWDYVSNNISDYLGAGRFITPYYVINIFMIPGIYLGMSFSINDRNERYSSFIKMIFAIVLSIVAGNPLPIEFLMLFTSPFLLCIYLTLVGVASYTLVSLDAFLGFVSKTTNTIVAMPGSLPDFVVNIRNANLANTLIIIAIVGLAGFILSLLSTWLYYNFFAFDFASTGKGDRLIKDIVNSVGGKENIVLSGAGLFKLNVYLKDSSLISLQKVQALGPRRVAETKNGISFEFGTSSYAISKRLNKMLGN